MAIAKKAITNVRCGHRSAMPCKRLRFRRCLLRSAASEATRASPRARLTTGRKSFWKLLFAAARESAHGTFETSPMHRAKSVFRLRRASYANFTDTMSIGEFHEGRRMSAALFLLSACAHALGALLSLSSPASVTAISSSICRIGKLRSKPVRDFRSTAIL